MIRKIPTNKREREIWLRAFRIWQQTPHKVAPMTDKPHVCQSCNTEYLGNFCPRCSQKADLGRISWKSVRNGIMDIWGLGTRSLLYSIWQLLMRPGYFISDYISGKRQVSFPPVKMLFIVTVIYSLIIYWLFPKVFGIQLHDIDENSRQLLSNYYNWYESHFSWAMLGMSVLAIFPTWIMFRYAPRNTRHSLPEGFFIQVLFSVLMVVLNFFLIYLVLVNLIAFNIAIVLITMFYYIVGYMQLFGYGFWGTLWREAFVLLPIVLIEYGLIFAFFGVDALAPLNKQISADEIMQMKIIAVGGMLSLAVMIMAMGWVINLIATRKARKSL